MRWTPILLLVALAGAQEAAPTAGDDHDKFGFPIRFDAEIITLNDLARGAGLDSVEQLGNVANERDKMLVEKLMEKVGELYGLQVDDRAVSDWIERRIAAFESEAEFYESLAQKGQTLEIYRDEVKRQVLSARINALIRFGFVAEGRRLLPWDPNPSPGEVKTAFRNDPKRRAAGARVRWTEVAVSLTATERKKIYAKRIRNPDITEEELAKERDAILEPRLAAARAAVQAGKSVAEIAEALGVQAVEKEAEFDGEPNASEVVQFLQTAKKGQRSGLLKVRDDAFLVAEVLDVSRPNQLSLNDRQVVDYYFGLIAQHKQNKARAILQLRALDKSSIEPPRVRKRLRELVLTDLRQAHRQLRALGIH